MAEDDVAECSWVPIERRADGPRPAHYVNESQIERSAILGESSSAKPHRRPGCAAGYVEQLNSIVLQRRNQVSEHAIEEQANPFLDPRIVSRREGRKQFSNQPVAG